MKSLSPIASTILSLTGVLGGTAAFADTAVDYYEVSVVPFEIRWADLEAYQAEVDATAATAAPVTWSNTEVRIEWNAECEVGYYASITLPELVDLDAAPEAIAAEFTRLRYSVESYEAFSVEIGAIFASLAHDLECGFDDLEELANQAIADWRQTSLLGKAYDVELWGSVD